MRSSANAAAVSPDSGAAEPQRHVQEVASNGNGHHPQEPKKSREELSKELWAMTPAQREAAMWKGDLTGQQLYEWAKRARHEVPLINNEFAFIAASTPEVAEALERTR